MKSLRNHAKKTLLLTLGLSLLGVSIPFLFHYSGVHRLRAVHTALHKKGETLSIGELMPTNAEDVSNGAQQFVAAISQAPEFKEGTLGESMGTAAPGYAFSLFQLTDGDRQLTLRDSTPLKLSQFSTPENVAWLDKVRPALTNEFISLDLPLAEYNYELRLPHLSRIKRYTHCLRGLALYEIQEGRTDSAAEHLKSGFQLLAKYRDEPLLISQTVRCAVMENLASSVWELLQSPKLKERNLATLQDTIARTEFAALLPRALRMQRAQFHSAVQDIDSDAVIADTFSTHKQFTAERLEGLRWFLFTMHREQAWFLTVSQAYIDGAESLLRTRSFKSTITLLPTGRIPVEYLFAAGSLPSSATIKRFTRTETIRSILLFAIALERYRLIEGEYPNSPDELINVYLEAHPVDWFDGKGIRYNRTTNQEYRLWSIGSDLRDNDGVAGDASEFERNLAEGNWPDYWLNGKDLVWPALATDDMVRTRRTFLDSDVVNFWGR